LQIFKLLLMELIIEQVENHVRRLFRDYTQPFLVYHDIGHTINVAQRSHEIIQNVKISQHDKLIVIIAAWFHDTGQLFTKANDHETGSVQLMRRFFNAKNTIGEASMIEIAYCILATKMPVNPKNLKEEILCDADTYHLGTNEFNISDLKVKQETEARGTGTDNWDKATLGFLLQHKFYTDYCRKLLADGKKENIQMLKSRIKAI
jgi:predicted metal-dependent HD superfamily phosphohydrolase